MNPRIHILLPVHDRRAITERFVTCLLAQSYTNWHLVLIDDGSHDGTEAMVRERVTDLTVVRGDGNLWWGGALHEGYRSLLRQKPADSDLVLMINDDTEFDSDFFANAVATLKPRSLLLAQLYSMNSGDFVEAGVHWDWGTPAWRGVKDDEAEINCFSTRGLFMRFGDLKQIGGFHPKLLPHYLSDYEFTQRAHRKGFALQTARQVFLRFDDTYTGIRDMESRSLGESLRKALSPKAANNPLYWTSFIVLACPVRHMPANLARVWLGFLRSLRQEIRRQRTLSAGDA